MNKKLQLFTLFMVTMHSLTAFDNRKMFNTTTQWDFLEKTFIVDAHTNKQEVSECIQTYLPVLCCGAASYKYINTPETCNAEKKDFIKDLLNPKNLYLVSAVLSAGIACSQVIQYYMNHYVNRQVVADFLHNWSSNKTLTPAEFCDAFEALASIMDVNGDEAVLQHATEIVDIMQFMIMRHFDKRYEGVLKAQAINNIGDAKSILDLLKTSAEAAKGLGA